MSILLSITIHRTHAVMIRSAVRCLERCSKQAMHRIRWSLKYSAGNTKEQNICTQSNNKMYLSTHHFISLVMDQMLLSGEWGVIRWSSLSWKPIKPKLICRYVLFFHQIVLIDFKAPNSIHLLISIDWGMESMCLYSNCNGNPFHRSCSPSYLQYLVRQWHW